MLYEICRAAGEQCTDGWEKSEKASGRRNGKCFEAAGGSGQAKGGRGFFQASAPAVRNAFGRDGNDSGTGVSDGVGRRSGEEGKNEILGIYNGRGRSRRYRGRADPCGNMYPLVWGGYKVYRVKMCG